MSRQLGATRIRFPQFLWRQRVRRAAPSRELSDSELADAAGQRLRPVVITSAITLVGLAPTAYGRAGSNPMMTPMIMAIASGVAFGTLVTLVPLPCLYAAHQDAARWVRAAVAWLPLGRSARAAQ